MKLRTWRISAGLTQAEVAHRVGVSPPTIWSWEMGGKIPGAEPMARLVEVTGGAVLPNDFYDLPAADLPASDMVPHNDPAPPWCRPARRNGR